MFRSIISTLLSLAFCWLPATAVAAKPLTLGTGASTGVYLPIGQEICKLYTEATGSECQALSTGGSLYNVDAIRTDSLELGLVQSDLQYAASTGRGPFEDVGPDTSLRAIFSLHAEAFTVVASSPDIQHFDDLRGRRVNVGNPGSGQRATLDALLQARGESENFFALASELKPEDMSQAMCEGRLDAFIYVVGHPSEAIKQATQRCGAHLVDVAGEGVDALLAKDPYYSVTVIPARTYPQNVTDTRTFGVRATLMARESVDEQRVFDLVKAVFDNWEAFRHSHPALAMLSRQAVIDAARTAPLHEGARRYYESVGLLPSDER